MRKHLLAFMALFPMIFATPEQASAQTQTYMWGVGPRLGTIVWPGRYPPKFPGTVQDKATGIEKVRGDVILGVEGLYWADKTHRLGATGGFGLGSGYFDSHIILKYNRMETLQALHWFYGGGLGVGLARWTGNGQELLDSPYYPLRGEVGALVPWKRTAMQGVIFLNLNLPGHQVFTDSGGTEHTIQWELSLYTMLGVELQLLFGDFTPPRAKKKKNRKK